MDEKKVYQNFINWASSQQISLVDVFPTIGKKEAFHIDLSINNATVKTEAEFNNPDYFTKKLVEIENKNPSKIIAGGYLEKRALYTSDLYNSSNSSEKRNVHLGLDFWLPENTPVHTIYDGKIICAVHQKELKGYGGFAILKHREQEVEFYTLYGHLSKKSIAKLSKGATLKKGTQIGILGSFEENGEWVPHLHFQIMLSLLNYKNDFPGVILESELDFWKHICPNPNTLFNLKTLS